MSRTDRIKGVLVGQAVGDALGAGYEFTTGPKDGPAVMKRGGMGFAPGEWTDDTQQAVCVAVGMADPAKVAAGLIAWYESFPRDVGKQTSAILSRSTDYDTMLQASVGFGQAQAHRPPQPGRVMYPGSANGSLMRTGPVALAYLGERDEIARAAREVSDLTHWDPEGWTAEACVIWSLAIDHAVHAGTLWVPEDIMAGLEFVDEMHHEYWIEVINEVLSSPVVPAGRNGSAVGAFKVALYAVVHSSDVDSGLQIAISAGNDTDTTAAIAGQLLGAIYGMSSVPSSYLSMVHGWPGLTALDLADIALAMTTGDSPILAVVAAEVAACKPGAHGRLSPYAKAGGAPSPNADTGNLAFKDPNGA